ncbi:hypothetical protein [Spirosoma daeguense]
MQLLWPPLSELLRSASFHTIIVTLYMDSGWLFPDCCGVATSASLPIWSRLRRAVETLCAKTIRYRSRATQFAEVEKPTAQFLNRYRSALNVDETGPLEIRQLYSAGEYHVIVEGLTRGHPSNATLPSALFISLKTSTSPDFTPTRLLLPLIKLSICNSLRSVSTPSYQNRFTMFGW